ncbi:MAG: imidazolonepropionase [Calditrichaeota bacterium]|nr:MAG: imidazolonepropionase [Calditrichota bacterium]
MPLKHVKLIGPFKEIVPLSQNPMKGPLSDDDLEIKKDSALLIENEKIITLADFEKLLKQYPNAEVEKLEDPFVCLPGFIDVHTHMCWAGTRARDYSLRTGGMSYLEIAKAGGGILDTMRKTRAASFDTLTETLAQRCTRQLREGITTCEVKSGYGLTVESELKMLRVINQVNSSHAIDLVPTCLAAHMPPPEFTNKSSEYLQLILDELLPQIKKEKLANRVDIFIEESAFTREEAQPFLQSAQNMGFSLAIHVDQFTPGSSLLACELGAISADHLEASTEREMTALAKSNTIAVVLPGCSLGLGLNFAPARKLLDFGASVVVSTDWNPGSAPMGDLLVQAAILGAAEKLSAAEIFTGITTRAAAALELPDRGSLAPNKLADFQAYPCDDFREILYNQGKLKPEKVWKRGVRV